MWVLDIVYLSVLADDAADIVMWVLDIVYSQVLVGDAADIVMWVLDIVYLSVLADDAAGTGSLEFDAFSRQLREEPLDFRRFFGLILT